MWDGSLVGNMEGVSLSASASAADEPLLQSMRSDLEAAWEEHAAKKSKLSSPEKVDQSIASPEKVVLLITCKFRSMEVWSLWVWQGKIPQVLQQT